MREFYIFQVLFMYFIIHLIIQSIYESTIKYNMMVCTQGPGQQLKMGWR